MSFERWNTHFSTVVEQEVFGLTFKLAQDPNSHNLGTTVWDASIVLAKYLEKNARRGELSRLRAKGRRCLELGSGMGLGGLAFAMLGADVTLSDLGPILPLLERNYQQNLAPAVLRVGDSPWLVGSVGRVGMLELDWSNMEHYAGLAPPYDYILAADCVYSELAVPSFLSVILHASDYKTTVVIVNEFRSQSVHDAFMGAFTPHFTLKKVPPSKMDPHYQHPLIHIYLCKRRKQAPQQAGAKGEQPAPEQLGDAGGEQPAPEQQAGNGTEPQAQERGSSDSQPAHQGGGEAEAQLQPQLPPHLQQQAQQQEAGGDTVRQQQLAAAGTLAGSGDAAVGAKPPTVDLLSGCLASADAAAALGALQLDARAQLAGPGQEAQTAVGGVHSRRAPG